MKLVNNNILILFISILFLSCEVFYPYEDDFGVVGGSNKIIAGTCFDTDGDARGVYGSGCDEYDLHNSWCHKSTAIYGDFNARTMCCSCYGGYVADGTEDCPYNPEIHN